MKKLFLLLALVMVFVSFGMAKKTEQLNGPAVKLPSATMSSPEKKVNPKKNISEANTILSFDELEENFESLEVSELQAELEKVDKSRKKLELMESFNRRKLSQEEALELTNFIRARVVLTKLVMERKFEELEVL